MFLPPAALTQAIDAAASAVPTFLAAKGMSEIVDSSSSHTNPGHKLPSVIGHFKDCALGRK